jgi:hypothetical protein
VSSLRFSPPPVLDLAASVLVFLPRCGYRSVGLRFVPPVPAREARPLSWALGSFYRSAVSDVDFFRIEPPASFLLSSCEVDSRFPAAVRVFPVSIFCPPVFGSFGATGSISCLGFVRPKRQFAFLLVCARFCRSRFRCRRLSSASWSISRCCLFSCLIGAPRTPGSHFQPLLAAVASRCCQFRFCSEKLTPD